MTVELSFHGGAGTVTGSRHLLAANGKAALIDAGMFQGLKQLRELNWARPRFNPENLDTVLLTHAHIDHSGWLPRLVKLGYRGPVFCTPPTVDLLDIMLRDSARLQEEDARRANRKGYTKHRPAEALYSEADVEQALKLLRPVDYGEAFEMWPGARVRFINVGHILGSSMIEVRLEEGPKGSPWTVVFSGDVGRYSMPLHRDPEPPPACDCLVVESTYGDREHRHEPLADQLVGPFQETAARDGTILIPSFAVGRAQQVTLLLRELMEAGKLREMPIHIDSPMAVDATALYQRYNNETHLDEWLSADGQSRLFPRRVHFHRSANESRELNKLSGPRVIISSSGMMSGGRILHHLKRVLGNPDDLLCLVGYQAKGTRGRKLLDGANTMRIHGQDWPIRCHTLVLHGMSGHADRNELLRWIRSGAGMPAEICVVHGEARAARALARKLRQEKGVDRVIQPERGERFRPQR